MQSLDAAVSIVAKAFVYDLIGSRIQQIWTTGLSHSKGVKRNAMRCHDCGKELHCVDCMPVKKLVYIIAFGEN